MVEACASRLFTEPRERPLHALFKLNMTPPAWEQSPRESQIRTSIGWVMRQRRQELHACAGHQLGYIVGNGKNRQFAIISYVDRSCIAYAIKPEVSLERIDHVTDVAPTPSLLTGPVDRYWHPTKRLHDKIRDRTPIVCSHPWTIDVEKPHNLDSQPVHSPQLKEQRFSAAFAFIVGRARTCAIHRSAIGFRLR